AEIDPRNRWLLQQTAQAYWLLRRFTDMERWLDRMLTAFPEDPATRMVRALVDLELRADTEPVHRTIQYILAEDPSAVDALSEIWFYVALCRRDASDTARALASLSQQGIIPFGVRMPRSFCEGLASRARNDLAAAETAFKAS